MAAQDQSQPITWRTKSWGTLGWLETAAKGVGILVGMIAFFLALPLDPIPLEGLEIAPAVLLAGITLGVFASVLVRIYQKEIISIIFAIANAVGHVGMSFYLLRGTEGDTLPVIFGIAYIVGELIKQRFLSQTGYTELGAKTPMMLMASRGLMLAYILFTVLVLIA